ncbi:MAG: DUF6600 domain-containing protein, partial [Kofleriaceae bacterium]
MRLVHTSALVAIALVGCVSQADTTPEYGGEYAGVSTGPGGEYESSWVGPPGGAMDPGYGYEDPNLAADPNAEYAGVDESQLDGATDPAAGTDAGAWAGSTAEVTDAEIDMTLDAYGEWVEDPDYGRVWRPYTTVVGADFTPYESCGSWIFTEYGWTFQSCDAWSWGWLPFHFGRWVYLEDSWCWTRDYTWGPGWVEWRHGGGYVGWRPQRPTRQIRDHRDRYNGPIIRDHRRGKNPEWRFTRNDDFGRRPIRQTPAIDVREGLRATTSVAQPPIRGEVRGRVGSVMAGRLRDHQRFETRTRGTIGQSTRGYQPSRGYTNSVGTSVGTRGPARGYNNSVGATRGYNPTYNPTVVSPNPNRPTWNRGNTGYRYNPPANRNGGYRYNPPTNRGPSNTGYRYNPPTNRGPSNNGYRYNPPTNRGPSNTGYRYNPPTNRGPSNSGYRYNPPSRSGSSGGYRYNPPSSRPSPSWGGSRGSTSSGSSRPSVNTRGSSPSRSYSAPSRGSSYSAPSRSSGGSR